MKNWGVIIKLAGLILIIYLLFSQLAAMDWKELIRRFSADFSASRMYYLLIVLLLMPVNYWLEVKKWEWLTRSFIPLNTKSSWRSVLSGLALANSTPLRLGDYAGRVLHLSADDVPKALIANFVASLIQNIVNLSIGFILLYFYLNKFNNHQFDIQYLYAIGLLLIVLVLSLISLNRNRIEAWANIPFLKKIKQPILKHIGFLKAYNRSLISKITWLSVLRYLIYLFQYYFVLLFFGAALDTISAIQGIAVVYLIQSAIPLPAILGFVARAEIALIVWGVFSLNPLIILCASYGLWIINQLIPSLGGMIFLSQLKVPSLSEMTQSLKNKMN
jgi:hypothetical protein